MEIDDEIKNDKLEEAEKNKVKKEAQQCQNIESRLTVKRKDNGQN